MIKIAIAEDNFYALKAIEEKLTVYADISIIYTAQNGVEFLELLAINNDLDLILMDIEMPIMNGIETVKKVKQQFSHIKIVIMTIYDDDDHIFNAIKAGADSYILKETKAEKVYETIIDTLNGGAVMSPSIAFKALQALKRSTVSISVKVSDSSELTDREIEVLEYLREGYTNKRIAETLFISPFTVKRHIENIYRKLQVQNRVELVDKAKREGLI
ncbi:response regulator transcription factor [Pedobacter flavus]|uniref:Response regulator transcription factor n=1 Tax=Pedobacter flavus TaxID=3113906 RepID=A0ABU7GYQ6_9SPHI|nr:response regulator transcription factor [Pedobacter sp. VNH31]MEE1884218.1 response regulator transcription factor [Pedobacter sp. VNH31]